jgi:hypothetical protein
MVKFQLVNRSGCEEVHPGKFTQSTPLEGVGNFYTDGRCLRNMALTRGATVLARILR